MAAVSTGFPAGLVSHEVKLREIADSVAAGAAEIDIVISRHLVLTGDWRGLYDEVRSFRAACGDAHIKTILATGELATLTNVARASLVCMMAGRGFHQDLDRQGTGQRDAAGQPGHGASDP